MRDKIKIICVVGATASGKTALGVALAQRLNGEVISADSMQVYRDMPIATAAATPEEQQGIPHHLLGFLAPDEPFSVAEFVRLAREEALAIHARGRVPIVVGGTGLFIDSFVQNLTFADVGADEALRERLSEQPTETLYEALQKADPQAAADIHPNNRKRVIRALELQYGGAGKTAQNEQSHREESPFEALYIQIDYRDRDKLYDRINRRVDQMLAAGLEDEARKMLPLTGATARQAIGHKELAPYFEGKISLAEAAENLKRETRHYAKRQLTWFRRNKAIRVLYADEMTAQALTDGAVQIAEDFLNGEGTA